MTAPWRSGLPVVMTIALAVAGVPSEGRAELSYDVSLGAGAVLNDNLHLDPASSGEPDGRTPVEETSLTVDPVARVSWTGPHDQLELAYRGQYATFQGDEDRDPLWIHDLASALVWRRWSPFFLEALEQRDRASPSQENENVAAVDQVDRNRLSARTGMFWNLNPRCVAEVAYRGFWESYPGAEGFDQTLSHYGETLVRYRWSPLWGSELRLAYGKVGRDLAPDSEEVRASAALDQRASEHLRLRYRVEWVREAEDDPAADAGVAVPAPAGTRVHRNLLKEARITGDLARGGSWDLAYLDNLEYRADGDTLRTGRASAGLALRARLGSALFVGGWYEAREYRDSGREETAWGPTVTASWVMTRWATGNLEGAWTRTAIREAGQPDVEDRTTRAGAGAVIAMGKTLHLEAGYSFVKNGSTGELRSYKNNILYARLSCRFRSAGPGGPK